MGAAPADWRWKPADQPLHDGEVRQGACAIQHPARRGEWWRRRRSGPGLAAPAFQWASPQTVLAAKWWSGRDGPSSARAGEVPGRRKMEGRRCNLGE